MKKDNKGFTLIELLIVIAIILSITAIGVVSFINISKARKQEAYEDVKNQVVTAAEQYFETNEYVINDMEDGGEIEVGIGKLVEEDYMNTVVNPVTGNKLNICDKIVVTKEGSRVNYKYVETNDSTCDGGNVIAVREAGAPKISLTYYNRRTETVENVTDGWLNYSKLDGNVLRVNVKADENNNGPIVSIESSHPNNFNAPGDPTVQKNQNFFDGEYTNVTYTVTNSAGKKATETISFKIDTTAPVVSIYGKKDTRGGAIVAEGFNDKNINNITNMYTENTWTNNDVVVYSMVDEELSGYTNDCTDSRVTSHFKWWKRVYGTWEGEFKFTCKATDGAGNVSEEAKFIVKRDITAPICKVSVNKKAVNEWYNIATGAPIITFTATDNASKFFGDLSTKKEDETDITQGRDIEYTRSFTDVAGNTSTCFKKISYDNEYPKFDILENDDGDIEVKYSFWRCISKYGKTATENRDIVDDYTVDSDQWNEICPRYDVKNKVYKGQRGYIDENFPDIRIAKDDIGNNYDPYGNFIENVYGASKDNPFSLTKRVGKFNFGGNINYSDNISNINEISVAKYEKLFNWDGSVTDSSACLYKNNRNFKNGECCRVDYYEDICDLAGNCITGQMFKFYANYGDASSCSNYHSY